MPHIYIPGMCIIPAGHHCSHCKHTRTYAHQNHPCIEFLYVLTLQCSLMIFILFFIYRREYLEVCGMQGIAHTCNGWLHIYNTSFVLI